MDLVSTNKTWLKCTWLTSELELLCDVDIGALSGCWRAEKEEGDGWIRGGVWPKALRPLCWDRSCWYATGLMWWGKLNDGLSSGGKRNTQVGTIKCVSLNTILLLNFMHKWQHTWALRLKDARKSCLLPSWSGSCWCKPLENLVRSWSIMVCRSMLASDSGEMDRALFLLSLGVSRGLEKRETVNRKGHKDWVSHFGMLWSYRNVLVY